VHGLLMGVTVIGVPFALRVTPSGVALGLESSSYTGLIGLRELSPPLVLVLTFLLFDLNRYVVHRFLHAVPLLWRVHEVHHSDPDFDVGTGARFHPLEAIITTSAELAIVLAFAPPVWAVFGSFLIATAMNWFTHANAALPPPVERIVRRLLVTPDIHRIHHSADPTDYSTNYGQSLTLWDRVFGTLVGEPAVGHGRMVTGVRGCDGERNVHAGWLLIRPFQVRGTRATDARAAGSSG
jgi:sterol desaturase/sphingolipid hydroxylase (fatty acid hydroxylase superfamily)